MQAARRSDLRHICQQVTQGCQAFPPIIRQKPICNALQQAINLLVDGGSCMAALHYVATILPHRERGLRSLETADVSHSAMLILLTIGGLSSNHSANFRKSG